MIRQAVIHLQSLIPAFRFNHETVYHGSDFVTDGFASRGVKPPESLIQEVHIFKTLPKIGKVERYPTQVIDWERRYELVHNQVAVNGGTGYICVDNQGYTFYAFPEIFDGWGVSIFWDGLKLDFKDDEETPFTEMMADAVHLFVRARISREVNHNLPEYESYMKEFQSRKPALFVDAKAMATGKRKM